MFSKMCSSWKVGVWSSSSSFDEESGLSCSGKSGLAFVGICASCRSLLGLVSSYLNHTAAEEPVSAWSLLPELSNYAFLPLLCARLMQVPAFLQFFPRSLKESCLYGPFDTQPVAMYRESMTWSLHSLLCSSLSMLVSDVHCLLTAMVWSAGIALLEVMCFLSAPVPCKRCILCIS